MFVHRSPSQGVQQASSGFQGALGQIAQFCLRREFEAVGGELLSKGLQPRLKDVPQSANAWDS